MEKLLIYIVAYNHEKFIKNTLERISDKIFDHYDTEILVNDDSSKDQTLKILIELKKNFDHKKCRFKILSNPQNLGYGGNQKIGYFYSIKNNFDYVVLLHGDGQYAPEMIEDLLEKMKQDDSLAVFGSRMIDRFGAIKGGMPFYKFFGNKILTFFQNKLLNSNLSEFHSGYRIYKVNALKKIPFYLNSNGYPFDTEIIIQFLISKFKISELPIPTYYGEEISYVNGIHYAYKIMIESFKAYCQKYGIFYEKKYDLLPLENEYKFKEDFPSPHSFVIRMIKDNSIVLDIGCNDGKLSEFLSKKKNCDVIGIDNGLNNKNTNVKYLNHNLNLGLPDLEYENLDYIVFLDVIEHLNDPEFFLDNLYSKIKKNEKIEIFISTPNISFIIMRFMLLLGYFNYGKRGILDKTHTRLFTFDSFKKTIENSNFKIESVKGIPAPIPLAIGENLISKILIKFNDILIKLWRRMFSYQIFFKIKPNKPLELLLNKAKNKIETI